MQRNYFVIRLLGIALNKVLHGTTFDNAFSTGKSDLFLVFRQGSHFHHLRLSFELGQVFFRFPREMRMPGKTMSWFRSLEGLRLQGVEAPVFDRRLIFKFSDSEYLFMRLYAPKPDLLLGKAGEDARESFRARNRTEHIEEIQPANLQLTVPATRLADEPELLRLYPFFKGEISKYLEEKGFFDASQTEQLLLLKRTWDYLLSPQYFVSAERFSLFEFPGSRRYEDVLLALDHFTTSFLKQHYLHHQKEQLLKKSQAELKKAEKSLAAARERLETLKNEAPLEELGHIIMANLHDIKPGIKEAMLFDFYRDKEIRIRLNPLLNAQQNAEQYYKKAKNRHLESEALNKKVEALEARVVGLQENIKLINATEDWEQLRKFFQENPLGGNDEGSPFREYELMGWKILVGKSARANDELISRVARKNDYWLHARNFAGSHVVIKVQPGKVVPKPVLEKAASLAAWFSKGKNESLCPVIYTERKYVRKPKGAAPGQVLVEKERVIMVRPAAE